jgi:hypothetical protein
VTFVICRTCGVEHPSGAARCAICSDERQWVPVAGQAWATLAELRAAGTTVAMAELEPGLLGVSALPGVGIGQQSKLLVTAYGSLLWDPIGYVDEAAVASILAHGPVMAVAASHPHMFGVQVEWSRRLGGVPVYVSAADRRWVARRDTAITTWSGTHEPLPGVTLKQVGGHFPGSAVVHFIAPDGKGVLLSSDSVYVNPDRVSVSFMRSFPNHIPQSAAVVERIVKALDGYAYDRIYGNFLSSIAERGRELVQRSAARHLAWVRGEHDDLT